MEIILHIGMGKSGSTALQKGLLTNERALSAQGLIYSRGEEPNYKASALVAGIKDWRNLPRQMQHMYRKNPEAAVVDYERWLSDLRNRIITTKPRKVIISDENLFGLTSPASLDRLQRTLEILCGAVTIVSYLRRPSAFYFSSLQQHIRTSATLPQVQQPPYKKVLERYKARIPGTMKVFAYDRSNWPDRDILRHFISKVAPEVEGLSCVGSRDVNTSISTEGMKILFDYRKQYHTERDGVFTPDTRRLVRSLKQADKEIPRRSPSRLRPEIAEKLDYTFRELTWLKEEYGVEFKEIEYDRITEPLPSEVYQPSDIAEIAEIDQDRLRLVQSYVMQNLSSRVSERRGFGL